MNTYDDCPSSISHHATNIDDISLNRAVNLQRFFCFFNSIYPIIIPTPDTPLIYLTLDNKKVGSHISLKLYRPYTRSCMIGNCICSLYVAFSARKKRQCHWLCFTISNTSSSNKQFLCNCGSPRIWGWLTITDGKTAIVKSYPGWPTDVVTAVCGKSSGSWIKTLALELFISIMNRDPDDNLTYIRTHKTICCTLHKNPCQHEYEHWVQRFHQPQ